MNKTVVIPGMLLLLASCGGGERPHSIAHTPEVRVTVPAPSGQGNAPNPTTQRRDVVQVYWDVSRSMREFAATRLARARPGQAPQAAWTDDLTPVVTALDGSVLLRSGAKVVEQYGVGERLQPLNGARQALSPNANRTALHLAAQQLGTALASDSAQAVLVVSDMELDAPKRNPASKSNTVCSDVPLPDTREAGSLFGRCYESAVNAVGGRTRTRSHLLVHVFRKSSHDRELFILLFATDRAFGRKISDELQSKLDFSRHVIFDSGSVARENVTGCTLTADPDHVLLRPVSKCFDPQSSFQAECIIQQSGSDAWIRPVGNGMGGVSYEAIKNASGKDQTQEHARVRFTVPCSGPELFEGAVFFDWSARTPPFASNPSVRDLFDSLAEAITKTVAQRRMYIGVHKTN